MANSLQLAKAIYAKKDEFYTQYRDIQNELIHYKEHFKDKTVLCNCNDSFESGFCMFFLQNFKNYGLERLICTTYTSSPDVGTQMTVFDCLNEPVQRGYGYVLDVSSENIEEVLINHTGFKMLESNGDFRSKECVEYLKQADIVVTNPPFSLFREYVALLLQHNKKFLIMGNLNAVTYKDFFPYIQKGEVWLGVGVHSGSLEFRVPSDYTMEAYDCRIGKDGTKYIRVKSVRWYTNVKCSKRYKNIVLYKSYSEDKYPFYDDYNAINVDKSTEVPYDYYDLIGVPISFLDKYNPKQFEIIGFGRYCLNGKRLYQRIVIKRKSAKK